MTRYIHSAQGWYARNALGVAAGLLALVLLALVLSINVMFANARQDAAAAEANLMRDQQNASLLNCVNGILSQLAGVTLPALRDASVTRDLAATERDHALQQFSALIASAVKNPAADEAEREAMRGEFIEITADLRRTGKALDKAQANLIVVRAENPYPRSTQTCEL